MKFAVPAPTKTTFYYQIICGIFTGPTISLDAGKLRAPSLALDWQINRLIEVEARVLITPGGGMSMLHRLFLWLTNYRAVLAWGPLTPSQ